MLFFPWQIIYDAWLTDIFGSTRFYCCICTLTGVLFHWLMNGKIIFSHCSPEICTLHVCDMFYFCHWEINLWDYHFWSFHVSCMITVLLFLFRYKTLDVKNILLESVSHHILPQMLSSPLWADSTDILRDYLRFMDDHFRESADLTFLAYRHRSYSKVS